MYLQGDINHCSNPAVACPNWNQQISHTKILHHCYSLCMTYAFYCDVWMEIYKAFLTQIDDLRRFHQVWNPTHSWGFLVLPLHEGMEGFSSPFWSLRAFPKDLFHSMQSQRIVLLYISLGLHEVIFNPPGLWLSIFAAPY